MLNPTAYPSDIFRTCACRFSVVAPHVELYYSHQHQAAHYGGLFTCGSVWACPVCAAKIQERRRVEIEQVMVAMQALGHAPLLVTFTFPHKAWDSLTDLLKAQAKAFHSMRNSKGYKALKKVIGYSGLIRSLEVTHGVNGWHPHTHELWFVNPSIGTALVCELLVLWERACIKAGLLDPADHSAVAAFRFHAVDVRAGAGAGEYLAKQDDSRRWGMAYEVAKASSKAGRRSGIHPHHFLYRRAPGDSEYYLEYVRGMKGKRQLFFTRGLKAMAAVEDVSDEVLAAETREPADLLGCLSIEDWELVRGNDARAELLEAAESGGWVAVQLLLLSLGRCFT